MPQIAMFMFVVGVFLALFCITLWLLDTIAEVQKLKDKHKQHDQ